MEQQKITGEVKETGGPVNMCRHCKKIFAVPKGHKGDSCPRCSQSMAAFESVHRHDIR